MLSKQCLQCEKTIYKKSNCSLLAWNNRVKHCSKECLNEFRRNKPSCSPKTAFQKGHKLFEVDTRKKRYGSENNLWKGGKVKLQCIICKNDYEVSLHRVEKSKFCSAVCKKEYEKSPESRLHLSEINRKRVALGLHNLYRGITELKALLRQSTQYKQWRESVFARDCFKCQFCGVGGEVNADHIKQFAVILIENNVKTFEDAMNCEELWNVENGRTLCVPCHKKTETYGRFVYAFINKEKVEIKI